MSIYSFIVAIVSATLIETVWHVLQLIFPFHSVFLYSELGLENGKIN